MRHPFPGGVASRIYIYISIPWYFPIPNPNSISAKPFTLMATTAADVFFVVVVMLLFRVPVSGLLVVFSH